MYEAYITRLKEVAVHPNADRLQIAKCFGNTIIVDLSYKEGDLGIYFPCDGKLGQEFAEENNLLRKKDESGNNIGGFIDPNKRNIKAIRLRGIGSDGLFLKLECLEKFADVSKLKEGDRITVLNGVVICEKYVPRTNRRAKNGSRTAKIKGKTKLYPFFVQHEDTKQLKYYLDDFRQGDICTLTLKMHGTSHRVAKTIVKEKKKKSWIDKLFNKEDKYIARWGEVSGSRRVELDFGNDENAEDGYYGNNEFRKKWHDIIAPKLQNGEEIFFELVGYSSDDALIMPSGKNKALNDEEFIKQYGETTEFTYGCEPGECQAWVYRMIKSDEDGNYVEYPDWFVRRRCEEMGLNCVPKFEDFIFTTKEDLMERVEKYNDGTDPIGKTHIREGVVVRIQNRPKFTAFKDKNISFKILSGIISESVAAEKFSGDVLEEI